MKKGLNSYIWEKHHLKIFEKRVGTKNLSSVRNNFLGKQTKSQQFSRQRFEDYKNDSNFFPFGNIKRHVKKR